MEKRHAYHGTHAIRSGSAVSDTVGRITRCSQDLAMLTMEQINDILCEELADDLPVAEHMMLWTADDIRKYAQEGGFWSPGAGSGDSVTDAELSRAATQISLDGGPPLGWEDYEQHAIPLDSPGGAALAAAMDDWWAVRCSELMGCFEPQAEGSWCGIASLAIVLRMLRPAGEVPSQSAFSKASCRGATWCRSSEEAQCATG